MDQLEQETKKNNEINPDNLEMKNAIAIIADEPQLKTPELSNLKDVKDKYVIILKYFKISLILITSVAGVALVSSNEMLVSMLLEVIPIIGLIVVFLSGVVFARHVVMQIDKRNTGQPYRAKSKIFVVGCIVTVVGLFTLLFFPPILLIGLILILIGLVKKGKIVNQDSETSVNPTKTFAKYTFVTGGFLFGGLIAAFYCFILYMMVDDHLCRITSSKCI